MITRNSGFSLVETLVAVAILGVMGTAVITITLQILAANNTARLKNQGISYAEEALEQARNYYQANGYSGLTLLSGTNFRDGNFTSLATSCSPSTCAASNSPTGNLISGTQFYRCVIIQFPVANQAKVQSITNWLDRGRCQQTEIDTYFANY